MKLLRPHSSFDIRHSSFRAPRAARFPIAGISVSTSRPRLALTPIQLVLLSCACFGLGVNFTAWTLVALLLP